MNSPCPALASRGAKTVQCAWRHTTSAASRQSRPARAVTRPAGASLARSPVSRTQPWSHAHNPATFLGRGSPNPAGPTKSSTKFNVHSLDFAGLFLFAWKMTVEKFGVQRAAVVGTGRRRPRRGWATSTKGSGCPVDFCYKCVGFVKRLAKYTVLCYDCKPKRKARNLHKAALQGSKPQHFRRRSFAEPTSFCTKRSPYAFIRKNKRAFPPSYGAGRS